MKGTKPAKLHEPVRFLNLIQRSARPVALRRAPAGKSAKLHARVHRPKSIRYIASTASSKVPTPTCEMDFP